MAGSTPIQLIVGLGNPGDKYTATRHNAGFWFLDLLARHYQASFKSESKFKAEVASLDLSGNRVWLLKPNTFMNLSGESLGPFAKYYQIAPENTLVVHDELDLPPGTSRYKLAGGHGGHNGLRHIFQTLGRRNFYRLRLGIGHPGDKSKVLNYVLKPAGSQEQALIDQAICNASQSLEAMVLGDYAGAMQMLHSR